MSIPQPVLSHNYGNINPWSYQEAIVVSDRDSESDSVPGYLPEEMDLLNCDILEDPLNGSRRALEPDGMLSTDCLPVPVDRRIPRTVDIKLEGPVEADPVVSGGPPASTTTVQIKEGKKPRRVSYPGPTISDTGRSLGMNYELKKWDVLCGRGRGNFEHIGNKRLRVLVSCFLKRYMQAKSRHEKSLVIDLIVEQVLDAVASVGGCGFVKRADDGEWFELSRVLAREKVGHQLRDLSRMQAKGQPPINFNQKKKQSQGN